MSAYQDLMTALATRRPDQSTVEDEQIVLAALAKHGHELAEQIRADIIPELDEYGTREQQAEIDGRRGAADLIDPKKSVGPVSPGEEPSAVSAPFVARYYRLHVLHEVPCDSIDEAIGFLSMRLDDGDCAIKDVVSPGGVTVLDESATSLRASARMWGHDANEAPVRPDEEPTP